MKKKAFWSLSPAVILLGATLVIVTGATFFLNPLVFYVEAGVVLAVLGICIWRLSRMKADIGRYLTRISGHLDQTNRDALALFPLPVVVASEQGEVLWYNEPFRNQVLDGGNCSAIRSRPSTAARARRNWAKNAFSTWNTGAGAILSIPAPSGCGIRPCTSCTMWTTPT